MSVETKDLEQRATKLREIVNQPTEKELAVRELAEIETRIGEQRKAAALTAAADRIKAIKRGYGSLLQEYEQDEERVRRAAKDGWDGYVGKPVSLLVAIETMNERFEKLTELRMEARDLGKDFGLPIPAFADLKGPQPTPPADILKPVMPSVRPLDVDDVMRMRRAHDSKREGPPATRYNFR